MLKIKVASDFGLKLWLRRSLEYVTSGLDWRPLDLWVLKWRNVNTSRTTD